MKQFFNSVFGSLVNRVIVGIMVFPSLAIAIEGPKKLTQPKLKPDIGCGYIQLNHLNYKKVCFEKINGMAIFEGDIHLGPAHLIENTQPPPLTLKKANMNQKNRAVVHSQGQRRWPNAVVPYYIANDINSEVSKNIMEAIEHIEENTLITFIPRTQENADQYLDHIVFIQVEGSISSSPVGRVGEQQIIEMSENASTRTAIHEIGHSLGLWHEQGRSDRNEHIQILWENINPDFYFAFSQHISDGDDVGPYDFNSVMHYFDHAFSINNEPTMVAINPPNAVIAPSSWLSEGDIAAINFMYQPIIDPDGDNVVNVVDNCPHIYNPYQQDQDNNGIGDVCDHKWLSVMLSIILEDE